MGLKLHQVNHIYETDLDLGKVVAQNGNCSECFLGRCVTTAGKYDIGFLTLVVGSPIPDADTLCTMLHSLIHGQPLIAGMLGCNDNIDIVLGTYAVIEAGKQTVCIGGKVHTYNICLFICNMIQETGILMCEAVVVLLPYIGGKDQVQGSDLCSPGELAGNLQPLRMLRTHRVYDTDECFVGSEESVTAGQQISL